MLASVLIVLALAQAPDRAADVVATITRAVTERMGDEAVVAVRLTAPLPAAAAGGTAFVSATPDPLGRLGAEITFTLMPAVAGARPLRVRAHVDVVAPRVSARAPILRGHPVDAANVEVLTGPVVGVPVRRLPAADQLIGEKALRPIAAGQIIESGFVAVRKAVQAGDTVTVVARAGAVQVTALFTAADSGDPGDIVRVVNPSTRRSIRVRVVNKGMVEVIDGR
jgi:flagella basal body P-ring formation protein FlgA